MTIAKQHWHISIKEHITGLNKDDTCVPYLYGCYVGYRLTFNDQLLVNVIYYFCYVKVKHLIVKQFRECDSNRARFTSIGTSVYLPNGYQCILLFSRPVRLQ